MKNNLENFLPSGNYEIWYFKPGNGFQDYYKLKNIPDIHNLSKTHVYLGKIAARDLDDVFNIMQGEYWSTKGNAKELLRSLGLTHTSMSVGDIIKDKKGVHYVDDAGFKLLKENFDLNLLNKLIENTVRKVLKEEDKSKDIINGLDDVLSMAKKLMKDYEKL